METSLGHRGACCAERTITGLRLYAAGGNNTVALAPLFESVRAVEINRTLAQAAEDCDRPILAVSWCS